MAYGTINADVIQTSTSGGILGAGNASIMKNRIINGAMVIDQRNAGATVNTTGAYPVDRFVQRMVGGGVLTSQRSSTAPAGFVNSTYITVSTADSSIAAADLYWFQQVIEGYNIADLNWGSANAKTVTLSFWVRSSVTGTFSGGLENGAGNRGYVFTYSIPVANTWTQISVTIAGDTTGTWATDNTGGISVTFDLGTGTDRCVTTANTWDSQRGIGLQSATKLISTLNATFYITGVQLEVGSSATGFEYVNYQTSLANCQRYYWKQNKPAGDAPFAMAAQYSGTNMRGCLQFPVTMRTNPTWSVTTVGNLYGQASGSNYIATAYSLIGSSIDGAYFSLTSSSIPAGYALAVYQNADAGSQWSAEL